MNVSLLCTRMYNVCINIDCCCSAATKPASQHNTIHWRPCFYRIDTCIYIIESGVPLYKVLSSFLFCASQTCLVCRIYKTPKEIGYVDVFFFQKRGSCKESRTFQNFSHRRLFLKQRTPDPKHSLNLLIPRKHPI